MRTALRRTRVWMSVTTVSIMLLAPPVTAQELAASFEQLRSVVRTGDTVWVTDTAGRTSKGRVAALSASSLELLVGVSRRTLPESEARVIELKHRDSLWNGTLIGLGAGAGLGALLAAASGDRRYYDGQYHKAGVIGEGMLAIGVTGAVIGVLVDVATTERVPVYVSPGQRSSRVRISPHLSKSTAGVQMSVGF